MVLATEGKPYAVATRLTASVVKISGQMRCDTFERKLAFSFTVIIST